MRFDKFSNIIEDNTSRYCKIKKEDYQLLGLFPIIDQGQGFIGGYTDDEKLIAKENLPVIIFGDHTKNFKYVDFPFTIGADGVKVLSLKNQSFNTKFYYYFLKTLKLTNAGYSRHFKYLKVYKLPIPDKVVDQLHIANILTKAENLIAKRKESILVLDVFLKNTFLEMFGDPVRNDKGWEKKPILNFVSSVKTESPKKFPEKEYEYIDITAINNKTKKIESIKNIIGKEAPSRARQIIKENDILVSTVRPNLNAVSILKGNFNNPIASTGFCILRTNGQLINCEFLFMICCSEYFINDLVKKVKGANYPAVSDKDIKAVKIPVPPISIQIQFAQIVEKTESLNIQYQQGLKELENLYGSLSQRAFRGELSLKDEKFMLAAEPEVIYSKNAGADQL